jgi:very-short-patch-repair endonuclease
MRQDTVMSGLTKDEYILRSLTKVSRKRWEYFVVSRILHRLDDPDIEFVTQQLVRRPDGGRALTDMYFPQFGIHVEIDEGQHFTTEHQEADKHRTEDIVSVTQHQVHRIAAARRNIDGKFEPLPLSEICRATDHFVKKLQTLKAENLANGSFSKWDFEHQFETTASSRGGLHPPRQERTFQKASGCAAVLWLHWRRLPKGERGTFRMEVAIASGFRACIEAPIGTMN